MKVKFSILTLLSILTLWSCAKEPETVPNRVIVEGADELGRADVGFGSKAGEQILNIEVEGEWEVFVPKDCTWLIADPSFGFATSKQQQQIVLRAKENLEYTPRRVQISFLCDNADQKDYVMVTQEKAFYRAIDFTHAKALVPGGAGDYVINVVPNNVEHWNPSCADSWVTVSREGDDQIRLTLKENLTGKDRVTFIKLLAQEEGKEYTDELQLTQLGADVKADLFDVSFKDDGTAVDLSPMKNPIKTLAGPSLKVSKNDDLGFNIASFDHKFSGSDPSGFYIVKELPFREKLLDGFSLEAYCTAGTDLLTSESKVFSSTANGGYALELRGKKFCFIYNGTETGSGKWRFVQTEVEPEIGRWYHLVGTWDKKSGIARCYVDGKLEKEENFGPVIIVPSQITEPFFTIGGNSGGLATWDEPTFLHTWNGSVARARIYSEPLTEEQVKVAFTTVANGDIQLYD